MIANTGGKKLTITVFMGDKKLEKEDYKRYICVSDYVINLVNEVYYSKIEEFRKRQSDTTADCG